MFVNYSPQSFCFMQTSDIDENFNNSPRYAPYGNMKLQNQQFDEKYSFDGNPNMFMYSAPGEPVSNVNYAERKTQNLPKSVCQLYPNCTIKANIFQRMECQRHQRIR